MNIRYVIVLVLALGVALFVWRFVMKTGGY